MNLADELLRTVKDAAGRLGIELKDASIEVRQYAGERMLHLSKIVDEKGYSEALRAEAVNVLLKTAEEATDNADSLDRELLGIVSGGLSVAARALKG